MGLVFLGLVGFHFGFLGCGELMVLISSNKKFEFILVDLENERLFTPCSETFPVKFSMSCKVT